MTSLSITLILLSALFHALWNYYSKASRSPQLFVFWLGVFTMGLAIVVFAIRMPSVPPSVWIYVLASGFIHFVYWVSLSQAYATGDISYVYPIARSAPGFIPLLAWLLLQEKISAQGLVGIFCVLLSIYLLQQRDGGLTLKGLAKYMKRRDSAWAFSTLAIVITYSLIDKRGMVELYLHSTDPRVWRAITYYLLQGAIALVLYGSYVLIRFPKREVIAVGRQEWAKIVVAGSLTLLSYTLILHVFMTEGVSYTVALRQTSVIFAVLLGGYRLKEPQAKLRLAAAAVMVIGVLLISTA